MNTSANDYIKSPPILLNSFPKSGTHLLVQVLEVLPNVQNYGSFIASMPTLSFRERSKDTHLRLIRRLVPDELVLAHLFYDRMYQKYLDSINAVHYFIYRDLRDVAISEAYYLTYMNRWHGLHPYFKALQSDEERITFSILGAQDSEFPYDYPDIASRFARYSGWLDQDDVFAVRFEDLRSERCEKTVQQMVEFYLGRSGLQHSANELTKRAVDNMDPSRSHTFRQGETSAWRESFTETHKSQMKDVAGELLIQLGYEEDLGW